MSLNSRPQQRPNNPPPVDAFTNYRPQAPPVGQPQRNNQAGPPGNALGANVMRGPEAGGQPQNAGGSSKPPPMTPEQSRTVARTHYGALKGWLAKQGVFANGSTRTNAREKLTRLTRQQFMELSTDVYDELTRRLAQEQEDSGRPSQQPFLPVRAEFHPKRNQARQKLATLALSRFRDLASDVYFELDRRYPEFSEEDDNPNGQGYSSPTATTPTSQQQSPARNESLPGSNGVVSPPLPSNLNARRAPTPQQHSSHSPRASQSMHSSNSLSPAAALPPSVPAGNDVVVPNKSTMIVEEPGARNIFTSASVNGPVSPTYEAGPEGRRGSIERSLSPPIPNSNGNGFNFGSGGRSLLASPPLGGGRRSQDRDRGDEEEELADKPSFGRSSGQGGHLSRVSETSSLGTKFFGGYAGSAAASEAGGRRSWDYEQQAIEKVKSEYEYKLTMLQNRVAELERENEDAASALRGRGEQEDRLKDAEREVSRAKERYDDQTAQVRSLQRENDNLRASSSRSAPSSSGGNDPYLRTRLSEAEELANELRGEVSSLVDELRQVNERCDELQVEVDREREERERAEKEAGDWKSKWQSAKMELRNIKATSQLFSSSISVDADYMPASSDGLIQDTSVAAFQTSIDDLLQAARSKEPSSVLPAARAVVSACEKLDNDIQGISYSRLASLTHSDQDLVNSLKGKVNATLSNLMTASKNHAMSFGVSPVSLLDAAASHLAATVVELVRILKIRRTAGGGAGRSSLDPSSAFGVSRNGSSRGFGHEPMPPLPEQHQSSNVDRLPSPDVGPALPEKEQYPGVQLRNKDGEKKEKSPGYLSGGMSSLLGGGAGSVSKALEAMGISSSKRTSVESLQDAQDKHNQLMRESTTSSDVSLASGSLAGPPGGMGNDYLAQQQSYPQYGQQQYQHTDSLDVSPSSHAYRSHSPSSSLHQPNGRASPYSYNEQQRQQQGGRNGTSYGYEAESQGRGGYGRQDEYGQDEGYEQQNQEPYESPSMQRQERDPEELRARLCPLPPFGIASTLSFEIPGARSSSALLTRLTRMQAYVENQSEAIVHSIQSLLSAIRSGASGSELTENLTQIITIVSSIVAISREALPSSARGEGDAILQELIKHCDQLSEMQNAAPGGNSDPFTKQTKQAMAAASFGVAKGLKTLNSLLQG
ncbi:hypothetical protein JCM11641_002865 [Rhodosporidiobolus odoratus]